MGIENLSDAWNFVEELLPRVALALGEGDSQKRTSDRLSRALHLVLDAKEAGSQVKHWNIEGEQNRVVLGWKSQVDWNAVHTALSDPQKEDPNDR